MEILVSATVTFSLTASGRSGYNRDMEAIHPLKVYRSNQTPKLSQAGLAKKLGVARLTVLRWETGERKIDQAWVPTVSRETGIPARELRPDLAELFSEAAQ